MLFEMLTGTVPFTGQTSSEIRQKIKYSPTPLMKDFYPPINDDLQYIVERALNKEPEQRYQSCKEFGNHIKDYMRKHQFNK